MKRRLFLKSYKDIYYFISRTWVEPDVWKASRLNDSWSWYQYRENKWEYITQTSNKNVNYWLADGREVTEEEVFLEIL